MQLTRGGRSCGIHAGPRRVGASTPHIRIISDQRRGRLLGRQLLGAYGAEIFTRADVLAVAIHHGATVAVVGDLDLSYAPPLAAPWDALQQAAHSWTTARYMEQTTRPAMTCGVALEG